MFGLHLNPTAVCFMLCFCRIFAALGQPETQSPWPDVVHLRHWRDDTGGCRQRNPEHGSLNLKQHLWENSPLLRCACSWWRRAAMPAGAWSHKRLGSHKPWLHLGCAFAALHLQPSVGLSVDTRGIVLLSQ